MDNYFSAIILMGGEGKRVASPIPKQFHLLGPRPVYQHTLQTFQASGLFQEIILVCHPDWISKAEKEVSHFSNVKVIAGGATRQASSLKGLKACHSACHYVLIHDAVRPFISQEILKKNIEAVLQYSAVDTCILSADTLLITEEGNFIHTIPPRSQFRRGQTPQTFAYPLIQEAHLKTSRTNATDDCQLVIDLGQPVAIVEGSEENLKITTEWDFAIAQYLYEKKEMEHKGSHSLPYLKHISQPLGILD